MPFRAVYIYTNIYYYVKMSESRHVVMRGYQVAFYFICSRIL